MRDSQPKDLEKPEQDKQSDLQAMLAREAALQERLRAIAADIRGGLDPDSEERAVQLENREVLEEIERVTMQELASVRQRIADAKASGVQ